MKQNKILNIDELKSLYADGYSLYKLQDILGFSRKFLSKQLKINKIEINYKNKSRFLKHNYFDNIDNEQKAYMLGFIFADGSINLKNYRLTIDLASKDMDILIKFSNELYGRNLVKNYTRNNKNYIKLDVNSKYLITQLLKYNITSNKTLSAKYPQMIAKEYNKHFIRGIIDGDGCIYIPKSNRDSPCVLLIGTRDICDNVSEILNKELNLKSYFCKVHDQDISIMTEIKISNFKQCKKMLDWLYKDSKIYLDRKYDKYNNFLIRYESIADQYK